MIQKNLRKLIKRLLWYILPTFQNKNQIVKKKSFFWWCQTEKELLSELFRPGQIACLMPIKRAWARKTSETHILPCKKRRKQIFSQIGKTMKNLQWIPNARMNTRVLVIFWCLYINGVKIALSPELEQVIRTFQTSMMVLLTKTVSTEKVNLKC